MMSKLYLMCGIPGSGKSTFAKSIQKAGDIYISRDDIRFKLLQDNDNYFSKEDEVFKTFYTSINVSINQYNRIFADATHLDFSSRAKILRKIENKKDLLEINAIYMLTSLEECIRRNNKRKGRSKVPEDVIKNMFEKLTIPNSNEPFDNVYIVHMSGNVDKISYKRDISREEI